MPLQKRHLGPKSDTIEKFIDWVLNFLKMKLNFGTNSLHYKRCTKDYHNDMLSSYSTSISTLALPITIQHQRGDDTSCDRLF